MRLSRQFQASFFYEKILSAQKRKSSQKQPSKQKKSKQKTTKVTIFAYKSSKRVKVVCFALWCFLRTQNLFVKKINWLEIVLIASFTILLSPNSLVIFTGFEHFKNSFRRNSVTYGTPCHAIGHFVFWYHHVIYRMPCHASGDLVIYR